MAVTSGGQETEAYKVLHNLSFETKYLRFKRIGRGNIYFTAKCDEGYVVQEGTKETMNICRRVRVSLAYRIVSQNRLVREDFQNVCIEAIIGENDVEEGWVYCKTCPRYIENVAKKVKEEILKKAFSK